MSTPEQLMYQLIGLRDELNGLVRPVVGVESIFDGMTLSQPRFIPTELGFVRSVSWLYGLYYEAGKIGVGFLLRNFIVYKIDGDGKSQNHYEMVRNLRTFNFHNLNPSATHDREVLQVCQNWFRQGCGTFVPAKEEDWHPLILVLLSDAVSFLESLTECVRRVELDEPEKRAIIYEQWGQRIKRHHPPHQFDQLIPEVLGDIGRDKLDPIRFRSKYYSGWVKQLETYTDGYDFEEEARKLIESSALAEGADVLPISGRDLISHFEIEPGPQVGELLEVAKGIYRQGRCDKNTLLARLHSHLKGSDGSNQ